VAGGLVPVPALRGSGVTSGDKEAPGSVRMGLLGELSLSCPPTRPTVGKL
jgi:hypothetical protein